MLRTIHFALAAVVAASLAGCDTNHSTQPPPSTVRGIYIVNEGAYLASNAEISFYDPATGTVEGNLFLRANDGAHLGDIANDAVMFGDRLFIVVNNSSKIEVVRVGTNVHLMTIAVAGLPRRIAVVSESKAYVSNQDTTVSVLDIGTGMEVHRIRVGSAPEGLVATQGKLYVLNGGFGSGHSVSVIDIVTDSVIATVSTPDGPAYGVLDTDGRVDIVCTGSTDYANPANDTPGALIAIDPATDSIVDTLMIAGHPGKLTLDAAGRILLLGPGTYPTTPVWRVGTVPKFTVMSTSVVNGSFYGIGYDREHDELLLSAAGDFTNNGTVTVHSADGVIVRTLHDGIGVVPSSFVPVP